MVIGIDTYRDSQSRSSQMVGFVASINSTCTRYYSRVIEQRGQKDLISGLKSCMQGSIEFILSIDSIIFVFRCTSKISSSQRYFTWKDYCLSWWCQWLSITRCYRQWITGFEWTLHENSRRLWVSLWFGLNSREIVFVFSPKLGMIVVKKRGSARFFARDPRNNRQFINPPPGTIIDHTVTNQGTEYFDFQWSFSLVFCIEWYDFYLISQMARQGTVAPTHFNVIWDRTGLKVDHMQRLTQKLCHLYYK